MGPMLGSVPYAGTTRIRFDGSVFTSQPCGTPTDCGQASEAGWQGQLVMVNL